MKLGKIYTYFFYAFLFSIPFQTRKVFLTDWSFYTGSFTEYGSVFLYISDIFLILTLTTLVISLIKNQKENKIESNNLQRFTLNQKKTLILTGILIAWMALSSIINPTYWEISLFKTFKILEMLSLVFITLILFKKDKILINGLHLIMFSGFFQSLLGIYQFISQKSFFNSPFLHKLSGETLLSPEAPGIAKIITDGEKLIRSYGTFPHPNILGGFILFSLFISIFIYLRHKDYFLSSIFKYLNIKSKICQEYITFGFWFSIFSIQFIALFTSFSRSAWIALFLSSLTFILLNKKTVKIVSRETIYNLKNHKAIISATLLTIIVVVINANLLSNRVLQDINKPKETTILQNNTFNDRAFYKIVSRETISREPMFGSGPGTFIFQIEKKTKPSEPWQYQPAHNIYLLSASETGFIGLTLFLLIIFNPLKYALDKIVSRETIYNEKLLKSTLISIMIGFLFIGFFDHYLYTLQQGQIIFWLIIGIMLL
jgi:hypothetical protein